MTLVVKVFPQGRRRVKVFATLAAELAAISVPFPPRPIMRQSRSSMIHQCGCALLHLIFHIWALDKLIHFSLDIVFGTKLTTSALRFPFIKLQRTNMLTTSPSIIVPFVLPHE